MSQVTAEMVKTLRERTGVGMSKCKKALDEAGGDIDKAIEILRKAGVASAVKKSERATNEGLIGFAEGDKGISLVEVNAETDFVVKNEKFIEFVNTLADLALKNHTKTLDELLALKLGIETVEETRVSLVQSIGENIQVRRVKVFEKEANTSYGLYRHSTGKILTLAVVKGSDKVQVLAKDIAMHIAADAPDYLNAEDIPEAVIEKEKEIAATQIKNKPPEIIEKILVGKIKAFSDQVCLTGQKFVKDPSVSVQQHVEAEAKTLGTKLEISEFLRWEVGGA